MCSQADPVATDNLTILFIKYLINSISGNFHLTRHPATGTLGFVMIVIGLHQLPEAEAEKRFPMFAWWLKELRRGSWKNWSDFLRYYPAALRMDGSTVHIPLAKDGSGIVSAVSFERGIIRLLRIALSPPTIRPNALSHPKHQPQPHATIP